MLPRTAVRRLRPALAVLCLPLLAALAPVAAPAAPAAEEGERFMVRAFPLLDEQVPPLAARVGHLGWYAEKGFALVEVDEALWRELAAAGWRIELDEERTAWLHLGDDAPENGETIPGFPCYRTVEETYAAAAALAAARPDLATWIDIGDSWQKVQTPAAGYDLHALVLTNESVPGPKPPLLVTAAIHAREYTTAELLTRFAEWIVGAHGSDAEATWMLDHHALHFVLHANPDGRKRAETGEDWRKNVNSTLCASGNYGIDLNRNFDFEWGCCGGSSTNPCVDTYRGTAPASEPETQAIQAYMQAIFQDWRPEPLTEPADPDAEGVYVDLHSFSPAILSVWGFLDPGTNPPPNGPELLRLGRKWGYLSGYPAQLGSLYVVDGSTKDYSYGELGIPGYTWELGTSFFESCASFEANVLPAGLAMLRYAARVARAPYRLPAGPDLLLDPAWAGAAAQGALVPVGGTADDTRYGASGPAEGQTIAAAELYVDTPPWSPGATAIPLDPADGLFDETSEEVTVELPTGSLALGRHALYLRGQDAGGHWGPVTAAFLDLLDPATAPRIAGSVIDGTSGMPLAARVAAGPYADLADAASGAYEILLPAGTYDVAATHDGYGPATVSGVVAAELATARVEFTLAPFPVYTDGESGAAGWTTQAPFPWALTTEQAHSPTHSWTDSPAGNYGNNRNTSLTSPLLDLSTAAAPVLSFWHRFDLESGWDYGRVEVSANGGGTWVQKAQYSGAQGAWQQVELAVPELAGSGQAQVRFRLTTDGSEVRDGWYVDDVGLRTGPAPDWLFVDGAETGSTARWSAATP